MGIGPGDARNLSLWDYEAMLYENNARYNPAGTPVPKPSKDKVRSHLERLAADSRFTGPRPN